MAKSGIQKSTFAFYGSFWGLIIALFIVVITSVNIMHFAVEDYFNIPAHYSLIFGIEYARSISWLIIAVLAAVVFGVTQKLVANSHPEFFEEKSRKRILNTLLVLCVVFGFFYIVAVLYEYFSGESDPVGIYRIAITLASLVLSTLYVVYESRQSAACSLSKYMVVLGLFLTLFGGVGIIMTYTYANPKIMYLAREDQKTINKLTDLVYSIENFDRKTGQLPHTLSQVYSATKPLHEQDKDFSGFTYTKKTNDTYQICFDLVTDSKDAKRIMNYFRQQYFSDTYQKGRQCPVYRVTKEKENTNTVLLRNNVHVQVDLKS